MTDEIGPGDWVECIASDCFGITYGGIYQCKTIEPLPTHTAFCRSCKNEEVQLTIHGHQYTGLARSFGITGWCPCNFRPMRRTTDFTSLLTTTPQEVEPA